MSDKLSRRGFFKSFPSFLKADVESQNNEKRPLVIRPPYLSESADFTLCKDCIGSCIKSCEESILYRLEDGSPYVKFEKTGCTFCGKCLDACDRDVLNNPENRKIGGSIFIDKNKCLSWNKVMCFSCKDPCLDNAIKFKGLFNPEIDPLKCSICGFCVLTCPTNAIVIEGV